MRKILKVVKVADASQADRIGIKTDDRIVSYNGARIATNTEFSNAVFRAKEKRLENIEITLYRNGDEQKLNASTEP